MDRDVLNMFGVLLAIGTAGMFTYGGFVFIKLMARRVDRAAVGAGDDELNDLRSRLADLDLMQARIVELEERVDFSERMLARPSQP